MPREKLGAAILILVACLTQAVMTKTTGSITVGLACGLIAPVIGYLLAKFA